MSPTEPTPTPTHANPVGLGPMGIDSFLQTDNRY